MNGKRNESIRNLVPSVLPLPLARSSGLRVSYAMPVSSAGQFLAVHNEGRRKYVDGELGIRDCGFQRGSFRKLLGACKSKTAFGYVFTIDDEFPEPVSNAGGGLHHHPPALAAFDSRCAGRSRI